MSVSRHAAGIVLAIAALSSAPSRAVLPFADTGHLYVSMWSADEIAVFADDGTPLERFSAEGLDGPRGLAFHPDSGDLWVASELGDAVFVFDAGHRLRRTIEHLDLDGPVAVTFSPTTGSDGARDVLVSNSDGDEILVFTEDGRLSRRFGAPWFDDPGCAAFMPDGSLFVADRLGGSVRRGGAVTRFDAEERVELDFTTDGLVSTMAIARDPNVPGDALDDTLWVTSGAGTLGIHEFDTAGNLLRSVLPGDLGDAGVDLVPQGLAFTGDGRFLVVSLNDAVLEFDGEGNLLSRFPTGPGTSRSAAFRRCDGACADAGAAADGGSDAAGSGGGGAAAACGLLAMLWSAMRLSGRIMAKSPIA